MILVIITALAAVCCADKLDKTYLPPPSAKTAGGNAGFLQTPFARSLEQGPKALPAGGFTNDFQGVVVDAANPGSRASGFEGTGLGGPRSAYGSVDSKVGQAAFTVQSDDVVSSRIAPGFDSLVYATEENKPGQTGEASLRLAPGFNYEGSDAGQDFKSQVNSLKFDSDVRLNNYNYGFETENGIAAGQNGEAAGGVKAQGGYEYKGNDGQHYKVTYTADKDGFKPQGSHLPTPPPVPHEILVSLEQNAKDEAAGVVDDGSYDAQKYNDEGFYSGFNQDKQNVQAFAGDSGSGSFSSQNQGSQFGSGAFSTFGSSSQAGFSNQQSTQLGGFKSTGLKPVSKTENRFGPEPSEGGNAFSTAFTSGSGIATAFAQAGSAPSDTGTNVAPSVATPLAYGSGNQYDRQPVASADSQPGLSTSFASVQGLSGSASSFASNDGLQNQNTNSPTSATASASVTPQPETEFGIKSQFGNYPESQFNRPGFPSFPIKPGQNAFGSTFGGSNYQLNKPGQLGFSSQQNKFGSYSSGFQGKPSGFFASTTKPSINQPQGPDSSYYYNQPSKPFSTPVSPVSSNSSPPKFPNTFISPTTITQTTSSANNGITQANISSFPSSKPTAATQFGSQSSQFGLKPTGSSDSSLSSEKFSQTTTFNKPLIQTGQNTFAQNTVGSTQAPIQEYQGTIYEYNKPAETLPTPSPVSKKPANSEAGLQLTDGTLQSGIQSSLSSSNTAGSFQSVQNSFNAQSTGSQFGQKPSTISGSKFSQSQFGSSQFGQKPFGSSQTSNYNSQNTPQNTYGASSSFGTQSSQFEQKPTLQQTQFGSLPGSQFNLKPQKEQTATVGQNPFGSSQIGTTFQVGSGSVSQFDKKPSTTEVTSGSTVSQGQAIQTSQTGLLSQAAVSNSASAQNLKDSSSTLTATSTQKEQTFQFNQKPFESTQGYKQGQFSSSFGSQFGQKPFVTSQIGLYKPQTQFGTFGQKQQSSQFSQKPYGNSLTGSSFQQSQFGSQFNKKPSINQGSSFSSGTKGQAVQTSQFPVNSQTGSVIQQTQSSSTTGFGQKPFNTQSFSSTVETQKEQNTQVVAGSQYAKKPETNQGSSFGSGTYTGGSAIQTTQFSLKPQSGESVSKQNQFGSSTDVQPQKPQTGTTFQQNQASSTLGSQYGQKPFGSSQTGSYFQKPSAVFGQKPVASFESGSQSTQSQFGQKPFPGSYFQQGQFGSQFAQKPQTGNVEFQQNQFGSQNVQKPQNNQASSFATTSLSGQKVQTSQLTQQNQVISTTESQFALKPQFTQEQKLQFGQKPFGSSQTLTSQSNQYGSSFGQNQPQLSQKPLGTGSTSFEQTQFGTSVSKFEQKPHNIQESGFTSTSTITDKDQTIQFGQKPTQKVDSNLQQSQFTTGSEYKQTEFAATSGSQLGQKPQGIQGSGFAFGSQSQFGQNNVGSQNTGFNLPSNQFGVTSGSKFSQTSSSKVQTVETSHSDNKPSGTQQGSSFSSNSQSQNVPLTQKPFGTQNIGSNFQQSQFGSSTFSTTTTSKTPFAQQPFGSQTTGSVTQQTQVGSAFPSQFPYTTSKPQVSYKPFGNTQGSYEHTQFGGSYFAKKPETTAQSTGSTFSTQTAQGSTYGSQTQKEFGSHTNLQQNHFGSSSQFNQPHLSQASAFASNSGFYKPQFNSQYKPFASSFNNQGSKYSFSALKPFNTQTTFGSQVQQSQFGSNEQKPSLAFSGSGSQSEVGQSINEKTQVSQGDLQNAGASVQSTSSPVGFTGKPQNVYGGYSYQKPQTSFGVTSRPDQSQQPTQATAFASSSPAPFGVSTTESFKESQTVSQFGSQSGVGTNGNSYGSTSRPQFGVSPVSGTTVSYVQPTQAPLFSGQTYKPFGISQNNVQKPIGSSTFGFQTQGSQVASQGTKTQFGQFKPVSTTVAPGIQGGVDTSFVVGQGRPKEEFGGPRDPPKFDDKTGYHY